MPHASTKCSCVLSALSLCASGIALPMFATNAAGHHEKFWGKLAGLFLMEGEQRYPMPAGSDVSNLLKALKGVKGIALNTNPETTVTEGQGYAMFSAGMRKDVETLKSLVVAWQAMGQGIPKQDVSRPCGGCGASGGGWQEPRDICSASESPCLCRSVSGAYMPGWLMPVRDMGSLGSATDGDEDGITGIIYLAELMNSSEVREYAVKSIVAFVNEDLGLANPSLNSRTVPVTGEIPKELQVMYLWRGGTCWGGYDKSSDSEDRNLCIAPAYFSPGQWRLFRDYVIEYAHLVPSPHDSVQVARVLQSAITWGYNTLQRISCPNGLVSNWWSIPDSGWPWQGSLKCKNSGTAAGAYGADAARMPWRVVLDYLWYPEETQQTPLFDEAGQRIGTWGAKQYANRWQREWISSIHAQRDPRTHDRPHEGGFPPLKKGVPPLRIDQVLQPLQGFAGCKTVPLGFTATAWNGWGGYPVVTTFQTPSDELTPEMRQEWLDFLCDIIFPGMPTYAYYDLGQEVIVSALLSGKAWKPFNLAPKPPAQLGTPNPAPIPPPPAKPAVPLSPLLISPRPSKPPLSMTVVSPALNETSLASGSRPQDPPKVIKLVEQQDDNMPLVEDQDTEEVIAIPFLYVVLTVFVTGATAGVATTVLNRSRRYGSYFGKVAADDLDFDMVRPKKKRKNSKKHKKLASSANESEEDTMSHHASRRHAC